VVDEPMVTEETSLSDDTAEATAEAERKPKRDAWYAAGLVARLLVIILIVLLLRDCAGPSDGLSDVGGGKEIVSVPRYQPVRGVVSVWVSDQTTIREALRAAGVRSTEIISLGGGRYVVAVPKGLEQPTVEQLKSTDGVFDAGFVYDRDNPSP
jgi:hypothetical protein